MTLSDRIQEIRDRIAATTPGPWHPDSHTCYIWGAKGEMVADQDLANREVAKTAVARIRGAGAGLPMEANMQYIAHSRADLPWAIDQLEPALARVERLEKALRECAANWRSSPTTVADGIELVRAEFLRRMSVARSALSGDKE